MKKKVILILIITCLAASALNAGGSRENLKVETDENGDTRYTNTETGAVMYKDLNGTPHGMLYNLLRQIGLSMDELTQGLVMNLHPFPNILSRFYEPDDNGQLVSKLDVEFNAETDLLTSSGFYDGKDMKSPEEYSSYISQFVQPQKSLQRPRFGIISLLFGFLLGAEVLFTAVWNYVTGKETFLFKDIVTKVALCLILFLVCAALPFLLEAVRWGLFRLAFVFYPPQSAEEYSTFNIFHMCGYFMNRMAYLMDRCDPEYIGITDAEGITSNSGKSLSIGTMGRLFLSVIYFIFKLLIFFELVKAALHIFMNIIEVYILLTMVMILIPFSVFTPTKPFGERAIMSLFNNLIECFFLLLVLCLVIPACIESTQILFAYLPEGGTVEYLSIEIEIPAVKTGFSTYEYTQSPTLLEISPDGILAYTSFTGLNKDNLTTSVVYALFETASSSSELDSFELGKNLKKRSREGVKDDYYALFDARIHDNVKYEMKSDTTMIHDYKSAEVGAAIFWGTTADTVYDIKEDGTQYLPRVSWVTWASAIKNAHETVLSDMAFQIGYAVEKNAEKANKYKERNKTNYDRLLSDMLNSELRDELLYRQTQSYYNRLARAFSTSNQTEKVTMGNIASKTMTVSVDDTTVVKHLVIIFICVYLPCYFILQSSQITQALMQGGVAQESFSNALSQHSHGTMKAPLNVAATATGTVGKTALDALMRRKPPNSIQGGM